VVGSVVDLAKDVAARRGEHDWVALCVAIVFQSKTVMLPVIRFETMALAPSRVKMTRSM
jgi:hypothetical protein